MKLLSLLSAWLLLTVSYTAHAQDILFATGGAIITVQSGANLYTGGGINLANTSSFKNDGTVTIYKPGSGAADFTDNTVSPYTYGAGKFVFIGAGTQAISSVNQFERIDVADGGLNLSTSINANTWYLISGKVNTGSFMAIATSALATAVQADIANVNFTSSWINGKLRRYITPATVNNYLFPVGNVSQVNIAEMDNLSAIPLTGVTYVTASFGPKPGNDVGLNVSELGTSYTSVNTGGVWYLVPDASPGTGSYDMKLFFTGFTGLADNSFGILRRPDASANAAQWIVPPGSLLPSAGSPGRTVAGGYARRNNISTFSQLGIGMSSVPLPLQLLSFNAVKRDKNVLLKWTTANEINTDHFEIYKGNQPASLQYLDRIAAMCFTTGNSNYDYLDRQPLQGGNFYQLKIVDRDNRYNWSQVVKIIFDNVSSFTVYPNPVSNGEFFIQYSGIKVNQLKLISGDGREMGCSFVTLNQGQIRVTLEKALAKGIYTIELYTDKGLRSTIVMVQ